MHFLFQRSQRKPQANPETDFAAFFFVTPKIANDLPTTSPMISSIGKLLYGPSSHKKPLSMQVNDKNKISKFGPSKSFNVFKEDIDYRPIKAPIKIIEQDPTDLPEVIWKAMYQNFDSELESPTFSYPHHYEPTLAKRIGKPKLRFLDGIPTETITTTNDSTIEFRHILELQELQKDPGENQIFEYSCKFCGEVFKSGCALGGHIAKVHRGFSTAYAIKRNKNKHRTSERQRNRFLKNIVRRN